MKHSESSNEKLHQHAIDKIHKAHLQEIRNMLKEFDQAQKFLKSQIQEHAEQ